MSFTIVQTTLRNLLHYRASHFVTLLVTLPNYLEIIHLSHCHTLSQEDEVSPPFSGGVLDSLHVIAYARITRILLRER